MPSKPPPGHIRAQFDGGSNCSFSAEALLRAHGASAPAYGSIAGISGNLHFTDTLCNSITFEGAPGSVNMTTLAVPQPGKTILSESVLLDEFGIEIRKSPPHMLHPCGSKSKVWRSDGLYYGFLRVHKYSPLTPTGTTANAISNAAARVSDEGLKWAARFNLDADGVLALQKSVTGVTIGKLSQADRDAINSALPRAVAQSKHVPVHATPINKRATEPGECFICDGFGKHWAASPIDGATYQFSAVCENSSFGYIATSKLHTVTEWCDFLSRVVTDARKRGHNPKRVRFDRAPELVAPEFKAYLESKLNLLVEYTSREHHEAVGRAERNHDLLTRDAEAMLQRSSQGTKWLLPARGYAQWLRNRLLLRAYGETRYQRYLRKIPDLTHPIPYAFGVTVSVVEDVRGPKGSLDHARGTIGQLVGIEDKSYLVWREARQTLVHQHHVKPLNELALIRNSLAPSVATNDMECQTDGDSTPQGDHPAVQPAAPTPAPTRPTPPRVDLANGTSIEVLWHQHPDGSWRVEISDKPVWWPAKVLLTIEQLNGKRRHRLSYTGWPGGGELDHDLASDDFEWRRSAVQDAPTVPRTHRQTRSQTALPTAQTATPPPHTGPIDGGDFMRGLRSDIERRHQQRAQSAAALSAIEDALECTRETSTVSQFNAALYQYLGDSADSFYCTADTTDAARTGLAKAHAADALTSVPFYSTQRQLTAHKASQNVVDVTTGLGTQRFTVPSTYRQLMLSEQKEEWLLADQKALDVILAAPGNSLVPQRVPLEQGIPIAPCVSQRKIKIDQATNRLDARNAFKSRHCVDGGRHAWLLKKADQQLDNDTRSTCADDMLIKLFLADAQARKRALIKADVPNAYPNGKRINRPKTYMALPTSSAHLRDDDGSPLCLELTTPMWGEQEAGHEWQVELERQLLGIGWRRAENVPSCWRYKDKDGDALLITIVDDLLFSESSKAAPISTKTIAALAVLYGDLRPEQEPSSFAGYRVARTADALTISMPQKAIEAATEHVPELTTSDLTSGADEHALLAALGIPSGKKMQNLADSMQMSDPRPAKLSHRQTNTQRLIGSLKFMEKVHPELSLILHRLACVMACPPPEAYDVARYALVSIWRRRFTGITYGGPSLAAPRLGGDMRATIDLAEPAPMQLEASADATWSDRNVYGMLFTYHGGAIYHGTKKIALIVDSSMESEAIASCKAGESIAYAREILRAFGVLSDEPTLLTTDNLANQQVATGLGSPTRSRHFLRRYFALRQRIASGDITMKHVDDPNMPADFLTKWLPAPKTTKSINYATNERAAKLGEHAALASSAYARDVLAADDLTANRAVTLSGISVGGVSVGYLTPYYNSVL